MLNLLVVFRLDLNFAKLFLVRLFLNLLAHSHAIVVVRVNFTAV